MLKRFIQLVLFLTLITMTACGSEGATEGGEEGNPQSGGELKVALIAQPKTLDPQMSGGVVTTDIMLHTYETLLGVDKDYNIKPVLAESFEQSEDGKTITFNLREDVYFHNGEQMVAEDVVASMERWIEVSPGGTSQFQGVTVEEEDEFTVVMTLPTTMSTALNTISYPTAGFAAIMPKSVVDDADDTGVKEFIGTGPFQFVEWNQDQHIHLEKFEDYVPQSEPSSFMIGKKEALVDDLYFIFTPDSNTQISGLQSGEYDVAQEVDLNSLERLENDPNITNFSFPDAYLIANFNKEKGVFTDVKMREAVSAALHMEEILMGSIVSEDYYELNHSNMMYHQLEQWNSDAGKDLYNIADQEKAKKLLEEAGYDGEEIIIMTDRDYEEHYNASVIIQGQLEQIGMNITLNVFDWGTVLENMHNENEYDMYVMGLTPNPEPAGARYLGDDYPGWTDSEELKEILKEYRGKPNLEEAGEVYNDLQAWYWEYFPVVRVGDYDALVSVRDSVKGFGESNYKNRPIFWNVSNTK